MENSYNATIQDLNRQKLEIYTQINANDNVQYKDYLKSWEDKKLAEKDKIGEYDKNIKCIDEDIIKHQEILEKLRNDRKWNLERKINQERIIKEPPESCKIWKLKCDKSEQKIHEIKQNLDEDMTHIITKSVASKMKQFELNYKEWDEKDFISWIKFIENGKFRDDKYSEYLRKIKELEFDGSNMRELNMPCLKL